MSSSNKSSGAKFAPKPKGKQAPHLGLHVLAKDGANVTVWKEALFAYAESNYHNVGRSFAKDKRFVRVKPTIESLMEEHDGIDDAMVKAILQQEIVQYIKLKRLDEDDEGALFALIGQITGDEGLARVRSLAGYSAVADVRNAHGLLALVIGEHTLSTHHASKREATFLAMAKYLKNKQLPGMTDEEYFEKFKLAKANVVALACAYQPTEEDDAVNFLMNMDPVRHGEFMRDVINRERAVEGSGIPNTVVLVIDAAKRFLSTPKTASQASASLVYVAAKPGSGKADPPKEEARLCGNCSKAGHFARECKEPCGYCSKEGHIARNCKEKKAATVSAKEPKRVMVAASATENQSDDEESDERGEEDLYGWNYGVRVGHAYRSTLKDNAKWTFTLDSFASESFVFCEDFLTDCTDRKTVVNGIHGPGTVGRRGLLPGVGPAIVSEEGGVNGVSLGQLERRYRVEYDQRVSFTAHVAEDLKLVFAYDPAGDCYSCVFDCNLLNKLRELDARGQYIMISTVAERESRYSKREVARAAVAREMMRKMYHPSDAGLIRTINHGVMTNCDVTGKDVAIATDIWGRDVASIRGKTKDLGPAEERRMFVPVMERKEQTVYCDVFHWRQVSFLLFVVKPLRLLMVQWLPKGTMTHLVAAVNGLANKVAGRGFKVTEIIVDPARELTNLAGKVPYRINTVDARTHVADAEVEIRTIKERMRSTEARLPYKLPRRAVRFLAQGVVSAYNLTLRAGETVCPRELFSGIKSDYARDMKFEFGQYVEATVTPGPMEKNGPKPRSVACIALCSTGNDRGGWWFMSLKKKTFFNALRGVSLPMPDVVIEVLDRIAEQDEGVKEAVLEPEPVRQPAANEGDGRDMIGMPTQREAMPPIVEVDLGAVTGNVVTAEELLSDEEEPGVESTSTPERQEEAVIDRNHETIDGGNDDGGQTAENGAATAEHADETHLRRSARIVERAERTRANAYIAKITGRDRCEEAKVHAYRVKTALALGGAKTSRAKRTVRILRLTIKKAMEKDRDATVASVAKEFQQLIDKDVWTVLRKADLTKGQLRSAIRSSMFLKEKYDAAGIFDKLKARLVAGGDGQDKTLYGDLSCPTVTQETVMMVLAVAAAERRKVMTIDITGAYLECDLSDEVEVIMKLDPVLTKILQEVDKTAVGKADEKGVTYVKLNKALYGTVQAAKLWYEKLSGVLRSDGFVPNPYDQCLFNKTVDKRQITVCFHVDDLLVTSVSESLQEQMVKHLGSKFANLTVNRGSQHSYLSQNIVVEDDELTVDMTAFLDKVADGWTFGRASTSPAKDDLFEEPEDSPPLSPADRAKYHSSVAQLLYPCKRTRVESLCAVSHLASRVAESTQNDALKLGRVLNYLQSTKAKKVIFKRGGEVSLEAYIDASFGVHADGRSRTGVALMMSGVCVGAWSSKQKLTTKSSTEAEIVALSDGLPHVLWMRELVLAQGHVLAPTRVHQDNQGVLAIMKQGRRPKHRTKHLNIRHFFARDREQSGDIELCYCPTRDMVADVLTKPVSGELLRHMNKLLGHG